MIDSQQSTDDEQPRTGHETKTRAEHLAWCKERALREIDAQPHGNGISNALASMTSDTSKHPETAGHPGNELFLLEIMGGFMRTPEQARKHIEGYR